VATPAISRTRAAAEAAAVLVEWTVAAADAAAVAAAWTAEAAGVEAVAANNEATRLRRSGPYEATVRQ